MAKKAKTPAKPKTETEKISVGVEMLLVDSSQIKSIGHLPHPVHTNKRNLVIRFHRGGLYVYEGVESKLIQDLLMSESHGSFFNKEIKDKYPTEKLE